MDRSWRRRIYSEVRLSQLLRVTAFLILGLSAFTVLTPGINTTVQSLPTREIGLGIPPSGPMDTMAFQAGNAIVGNPFECEGLELVIPPKTASRSSGLFFSAIFHIQAVVAVTGANAIVRVDGADVPTWSRIVVPKGGKLVIGSLRPDEDSSDGGFRAYLAVRGGFPGIPSYLGSKSTSMGSGGYQVGIFHHSFSVPQVMCNLGKGTASRRYVGNQAYHGTCNPVATASALTDTELPFRMDFVRSTRSAR